MAQHTDKEFFGQRVKLDGNRYTRCTFVNCIIVYGGGLMPELVDVVFERLGERCSSCESCIRTSPPVGK